MKNGLSLLCWVFFICRTLIVNAQDFDVYLMIGQSNMAGRGSLVSDDLKPMDGVWLLNPEGNIEPASCPMNKYSSIRKGMNMQKMSPSANFGKILHQKTGRNILLVVNARGGSKIGEWKKGNEQTHFYSEAVRRTQEAMKYGKLKGIIWHQGESDSEHPEGYISQLIALVNHFRTDFHNPDLPFVAGEIAQWLQEAKTFNPIIQSVPAVIEHSDYVTSVGAEPLKDYSDPHFNRSGSNLLGKRYAEKILQMVYDINK